MLINNDSITLQEILILNVLKLVRKIDVYLHAKKSTSFLFSFLRYCKDITNSLFCELWECLTIHIKNHSTRLYYAKIIVCQNKTPPFTSFLRYYILNNSAIYLTKSILAHNSRTRILADIGLID